MTGVQTCALPISLIIIGVIQAIINKHQNGSVLSFGYAEESYRFTTPISEGLYGLVFSPNKGLIFYAPLVLLIPFSLRSTIRFFRSEWIFLLSSSALVILCTSKWWSWEGGSSWGPRLLWPILPFLILAAGFWLRAGGIASQLFSACLLIGLIVNLLGVLVCFSTWNHLVSLYPSRIALPASGRPAREYLEEDGKRWFEPYVGVNYIPTMSPIYGHAWITRLRYFNSPFPLIYLQPSHSEIIQPVRFPPVVVDLNILRNNSRLVPLIDDLGSAHFLLWDTLRGENKSGESVYAVALDRQGELALSRKNSQRALYCFQEAFRFKPDSAYYCAKLSGLYLELGNNTKARELLAAFIKTAPTASNAILMLGAILDQDGEFEGALFQYQNYLSLAPTSPAAKEVKQRIDEISKIINRRNASRSE